MHGAAVAPLCRQDRAGNLSWRVMCGRRTSAPPGRIERELAGSSGTTRDVGFPIRGGERAQRRIAGSKTSGDRLRHLPRAPPRSSPRRAWCRSSPGRVGVADAQLHKRSLAAPIRRGKRGRRWIRARARSARVRPLSSAMPCSVTTQSASARGVVTTPSASRRRCANGLRSRLGRLQRDDRAALRRPGWRRARNPSGRRPGRYVRPCAVSALTWPVRSTSSARIDRDKAAEIAEHQRVMGIARRADVDRWVAVGEAVEPAGAHQHQASR